MPGKSKTVIETAVSDPLPEERKVKQETSTTPEVGEPNEAFFGTLLIGCLAVSLIAATGYFAFSGYRYLKSMKAEEAIPSIAQLPAVETEKPATPEPAVVKEETPAAPSTPTETVDKKTLAIKVLNGGAAKGVAGAYAEKLKKDGFTKTVVGNSFGNYTGATLYYAKGQEAGLAVLKEVVLKEYPALTVKEAESSNKDATAATFVLILGR